ncbi:MAG: CRISPR-associated endonuclease Cas2 [Anaerolineae bacterium]|nr:CRISPR-associated endonuclease Cas2 [Anaerolineae bacterium]
MAISYDISDDRRRNKIARALEGYGYRVQFSVFECEVDQRQYLKLQRELRRMVRSELLESVRFYPPVVESAERVLVIRIWRGSWGQWRSSEPGRVGRCSPGRCGGTIDACVWGGEWV